MGDVTEVEKAAEAETADPPGRSGDGKPAEVEAAEVEVPDSTPDEAEKIATASTSAEVAEPVEPAGEAAATDATQVTPKRRMVIPLSPAARRHGLGLLMALATLGVLSWDLNRPAMWLDESATQVATQRSWPNVWMLFRSAEAPLVPFYALLKVVTGATRHYFPHSADHVEILFRWPTVAVAVIGVWVLAVWLAKFCPTPVVLGAGVFLLTSAGFSRYGQEARPYSIVMLLAITCTVLWTQIARETRVPWRWFWMICYAIGVILMVSANSLSTTLIAAHLVASLVAPERGRRISTLFHTMAAAAMGMAVVEPLSVVMAIYGKGATKFPALSVDSVSVALNSLTTIGGGRIFGIGALLPLAFLGLTRVFDAQYRFIARLAAAWGLIPPVLWVCAVAIRPNLLIGRYVLFVLPAWAILAGIGTATLFTLFTFLVRVATSSLRWELGAAWALTVVLLGGVVVSQLQSMQLPRGKAGHGEDLRPALRLADKPRYRYLPILVSSRLGAVEMASYGPQDERRMIGIRMQRDQYFIWPSQLPYDIRRAQLRAAPRLILLMRVSAEEQCRDVTMERSAASIEYCMPPMLQRMNYHVVAFRRAGKNWTFVELYRGGEPPATAAQQAAASPFYRPATAAETAAMVAGSGG